MPAEIPDKLKRQLEETGVSPEGLQTIQAFAQQEMKKIQRVRDRAKAFMQRYNLEGEQMEKDLTEMLLIARFEMMTELMGDARQIAQIHINEEGKIQIDKIAAVRQPTQAEWEEDQRQAARMLDRQQRFG